MTRPVAHRTFSAMLRHETIRNQAQAFAATVDVLTITEVVWGGTLEVTVWYWVKQ